MRVTARGDQSANWNRECDGLEKTMSGNLDIGEYHAFTVPATCKYKIKIDIKSGEKKDRNLTVTPGCILVTKSAGTTTMDNKIKKKSRDWVDGLSDELKAFGEEYCELH